MDKAPDAYRTISEVGEDLDIAQHVLRFWETRFPQIKPLKRGGGRRYYRPDDVELLKGIRHLLYKEGYTIKGVQRILKEQGPRAVQAFAEPLQLHDWQAAPEALPASPPVAAFQPAPQRAGPAFREPSIDMADLPVMAEPGRAVPSTVEAVPAHGSDLFGAGETVSESVEISRSGAVSSSGTVAMTRGGLARQMAAAQIAPAIHQPTNHGAAPLAAQPELAGREALAAALVELDACREILAAALARRAP